MSVVTLGTQDKRAVSVRLSDCVLNNIVATEPLIHRARSRNDVGTARRGTHMRRRWKPVCDE